MSSSRLLKVLVVVISLLGCVHALAVAVPSSNGNSPNLRVRLSVPLTNLQFQPCEVSDVLIFQGGNIKIALDVFGIGNFACAINPDLLDCDPINKVSLGLSVALQGAKFTYMGNSFNLLAAAKADIMLKSSQVQADGRLLIRFQLRSDLIATKGGGGNLVNFKYGAQLICTEDGECNFFGFLLPAFFSLLEDLSEVQSAICGY